MISKFASLMFMLYVGGLVPNRFPPTGLIIVIAGDIISLFITTSEYAIHPAVLFA